MNTHSEASGHLPIPGPVSVTAPGPAALRGSKVRVEVLRALKIALDDVGRDADRGADLDMLFGAALARMSGALQMNEPEISAGVWDLLQEVRKAGVSS